MILRLYDEPPDKAGRRRICEGKPGEHGDEIGPLVRAFSEAANPDLAAGIRERPGAFAVDEKGGVWENTAWLAPAEPGEPPVKQPAPKWVERPVAEPRDLAAEIAALTGVSEQVKAVLLGVVERQQTTMDARRA